MNVISPDINVLDFDVLFDISVSPPKIGITNTSSGPNPDLLKWYFTVTTPGGLMYKTGNFDFPDKEGVWETLEIPNLPQILGQIEWGGAGYKVTGYVQDSDGNTYSLTKTKAIYKPAGCTKGNYGAMILAVEPRCADGKLMVEEKSNYLYEGSIGAAYSSALKLIYPPDEASSVAQTFDYTDPISAIYIPLYRDGEGYQLMAESVRDYTYPDGITVRIKYKFRDVFPIQCTYDLCCLAKSVEKYADFVQQTNCLDDWKKLEIINQKLTEINIAKLQPQCGIDIYCLAEEIKQLLGAYYDCGCCDYGIHDLNLAVEATLPSIMVDAGPDQIITLPDTDAALLGSASVSGGSIASHLWTQLAGPGTAAISSPTTYPTNVTSLVPGKYTFQLTATDNLGRSKSDTMNVLVIGALVVNAGPDQNISLPTTTAALAGQASVQGASIVSHTWTQISGPNNANISNPASYLPNLTGLAAGDYIFRLTALDSTGRSAFDDMEITVGLPPIAVVAGPDQNLFLPTSQVTLPSVGVGVNLTYQWQKESGPAGATLNAANTPTLLVTGLTTGTYVFRVTVTDQYGQHATDVVVVVVGVPAINAVVEPGATLVLPDSTGTLEGCDSVGVGLVYGWEQVSGPPIATISQPNNCTSAVSGMTSCGTYVFRLTILDSVGQTDSADVTFIVQALPVADAGPDQTVSEDPGEATLAGSATVQCATIDTHVWSVVSGPVGSTFADDEDYGTLISGLQAGTYVLRLTVTDSNGHTDTDDMTLTVSALPPVLFEWGWSPVPFAVTAPTLAQQSNTIALSGTITLGCSDDGCTNQGATNMQIHFDAPTPEEITLLFGQVYGSGTGPYQTGWDIMSVDPGAAHSTYYGFAGDESHKPFELVIPAGTTDLNTFPTNIFLQGHDGETLFYSWICQSCLTPITDLYVKVSTPGYAANFTYDPTGGVSGVTMHNEGAQTRTQVFRVGATVVEGCVYSLSCYGHTVSVTALLGDTPTTVATRLKNALNATTEGQWDDHSLAPAGGTPGFAPTATSSGPDITIIVDYDHNFTSSVTTYANPFTFVFTHSALFPDGGPFVADYRPAPLNQWLIFRYPSTQDDVTTWFNTPLNNGTFPDQVWYDLVTNASKKYSWTRVDPGMDHSALTTISI